jgi:hypothetical protein
MIANTATTQHAETGMALDFNKSPEELEAKAKEEAEAIARRRAIAAIPAIFIDTWTTTGFAGHVRVTLGEIYGAMDNFRAAFVLSADDAILLGRQLVRSGERRKARDKQRAEEAAGARESESDETGES